MNENVVATSGRNSPASDHRITSTDATISKGLTLASGVADSVGNVAPVIVGPATPGSFTGAALTLSQPAPLL